LGSFGESQIGLFCGRNVCIEPIAIDVLYLHNVKQQRQRGQPGDVVQ